MQNKKMKACLTFCDTAGHHPFKSTQSLIKTQTAYQKKAESIFLSMHPFFVFAQSHWVPVHQRDSKRLPYKDVAIPESQN
jgi:hypothetical protein